MSVALVTGAGSPAGIGSATALRLAQDGHDVVISDVETSRADGVADAIRQGGGRAAVVVADVASAQDVVSLFNEAERALGPVDVTVSNAGIAIGKPLLELTVEEWTATIAVNLTGSYLTVREAAGRMIARGAPGAIVLIGSAASKTGWPNLGAYSASKFGVIGLMQAASGEWGGHGIRVNAVCPGGVDTSMAHRLYSRWAEREGITYEGFLERVISGTPLGRLADPSEIADAVAFLASDQARYVTGESLNVTGGVEVH